MRFPRNARIFRGQLDAAPFAGVFFLFVILLLLNTTLIHTPGVRLELPMAARPPAGARHPSVVVALDSAHRLYFRNQIVTEAELLERLRGEVLAATQAGQELTLVALVDQSVPSRAVVRLVEIAGTAGIRDILQATRPYHEPETPAPPDAR